MSSSDQRSKHRLKTSIVSLDSLPKGNNGGGRRKIVRNRLTPVELEILLLLSHGYNVKQVAIVANSSVPSVNQTIMGMRRRFEASNIPHMVSIGFRRGWLS